MKRKVIVLNGSGGCGKDTFVDIVNGLCSVPVVKLSTVDPIKSICKYLNVDISNKNDRLRRFLSDIKDTWTVNFDGPFKYIINEIEHYDNEYKQYIVFVMCREPPEISKLVNRYYPNSASLLIKRPSIRHIKSNHADANVDKFKYNYTIVNDGRIEDLQKMAYKFIKIIGFDVKGGKNEETKSNNDIVVDSGDMSIMCNQGYC